MSSLFIPFHYQFYVWLFCMADEWAVTAWVSKSRILGFFMVGRKVWQNTIDHNIIIDEFGFEY